MMYENKTTYYDLEENHIITVNNRDYNRNLNDVLNLFKNYENIIHFPYIKNDKIFIKKIRIYRGIEVLDFLNLEGIACNLFVFHNFIHTILGQYLVNLKNKLEKEITSFVIEKEKTILTKEKEIESRYKSIEDIYKQKDQLLKWKSNSDKYDILLEEKNILQTDLAIEKQNYNNIQIVNEELRQENRDLKNKINELNKIKEENIKLNLEKTHSLEPLITENKNLKEINIKYEELKIKYNELIDEYDELEKQNELLQIEVEKLPQAKEILQQKIMENMAKDEQIADLINKYNYFVENSADKMEDAITIIRAFNDIKMSVQHIQTVETFSGVYEFSFKIRDRICDEKKIEKVCKSFPSLFNWAEQVPSFSVNKGELTITFDTRSVDDIIDSRQIDWVADITGNESNIAIFGVKGGGKTELITNLMGAILKKVDHSQLVYIQPSPESSSNINFDDYKLMPSFSGFKRAYEGLDLLWEEFKRRSKINEEIHNSNTSKKYPKFKPIFFVIDELQSLIQFANDEEYERDGKEISNCIFKILSLGRKLKINVITVGQSPDVSTYKWTKSVLSQFNCVYVTRDSIKTGIDYLTKYQEKEIQEEFKLYHNSSYREFYALIRIANSYAKIQDLPERRKYVEGVSVAYLIDEDKNPTIIDSSDVIDISSIETITEVEKNSDIFIKTKTTDVKINGKLNNHLKTIDNYVTCDCSERIFELKKSSNEFIARCSSCFSKYVIKV